MSKGTHALTYGVAHAAAPVDMTERTRVGSHVRANMHDDVPTIVHVNSHTGVLLLPYMHSHVNSGRTCGFTCGPCGVLAECPFSWRARGFGRVHSRL